MSISRGKGIFETETLDLRFFNRNVCFTSTIACMYNSITLSSMKSSKFGENDYRPYNEFLMMREFMGQRIFYWMDSIITRFD